MHHRLLSLLFVLALGLGIQGLASAAEFDDEVVLQPGKMGLLIETLTPFHPGAANDPNATGVWIKEVTPGGPADKLGLKVGDIIVRANDRPITNHAEVASLLRDRLVGSATRLRIVRGADRRVVDLLVPAAAQPILRIDAGMHNAPVRNLDVDAAGRWLVTGSEDKTAKVWNLATGRLAATLRPPVGDGNEGRLQAVAMAPDGSTIALGGSTGQWDKTAAVYLFDRASGRMLRQLDGLPARIEALAWSPDGSLLAVGVAGKGGVFVYRTAGWLLAGRDENYAGPVAGLDFDRRNRLVSSSADGQLRLYAVGADGLKPIAQQQAPGGKQPASVRFSPDAAAIAVGYFDSTQVSVLGGNALGFLYAPNTAGLRNGDLRSVAWSSDGRTLFAAGRYVAAGHQVIRSWTDAGRGQVREEPVAENSIFDLRELPGGGLVFCTAEPAWAVLGVDGKRRVSVAAPIADFRGIGQQLLVSADARSIRFSFERNGTATARFDSDDGLVASAPATGGSPVYAPFLESPGLAVTGWKNEPEPKLNGLPLRLRPGENSRSLAIAPDGSRLALGSDWGVSSYDRTGRLIGRIQSPAAAWAVNYSADGRYLVAAFADGTIRWYAVANGQEKLALFAHTDRQRWVAWTPSGYYTASAAGEELIGWHINNGKNQAGDFYPASRFRAKFYRPDVLARLLGAPSEIEALRLANQESGRNVQHVDIAQALPPIIDAVSPNEAQFSEAKVSVRYKVRNLADAPLTGIRVRVNGANVPEARNLAVGQAGSESERSVSVALPPQDSIVELFAENKNGVSSAATFKFVWKGAASQAASKKKLPTLHLLAIGVSKYRDDSMSLGFPAKDARDFAEALKAQKGKLYGDIQMQILTDKQATRQAVLDSLSALKSRVKESDVGVLFIAGHGYNSKDGTYYYVPHDFDRKGQDATGVVYSAIRNTLAEMPGRAMLFIDTCHSGNVMGKTDLTGVINDLTAKENNVVVFASSTQKETSQESDEWNNGAFTKALVAGLRGGGDVFKEGKVMYTGLHAYLSKTINTLTEGAQHPVVLPGGIEDFVVAIPETSKKK